MPEGIPEWRRGLGLRDEDRWIDAYGEELRRRREREEGEGEEGEGESWFLGL